MSSPGLNPLAVLAPDLYAKQIGIQRRQALGQALMEQGGADPGRGAFGGIRNAGNMMLGAMLAKHADQDMAGLYSAPQPAPDTGQISNAPTPQPQQPVPDAPGDKPMAQAYGAALSGQQAPQQSTSNVQSAPPSQQPRTIPGALSGAITPLPGMSPQQSMMEFVYNNGSYWKALNDANALTPEQKQIAAAYPGNPQAQAQALQGLVAKNRFINLRPGGMGFDPGSGQAIGVPNADGLVPVMGSDGQVHLQMAQGAMPAIASSNFASNLGKGAATPATGYDPQTNMPVATNQAQMSGNGPAAQNLIQGINPGATSQVESGGNPNAVSPRGAVGAMQTMPSTLAQPGYGVQPARDNSPGEQSRVGGDYLSAMEQHYGDPVLAHIAYNWGPQKTDAWLAAGADFKKLPLETQLYLGRTAAAQMAARRGQNAPAQAPASPQRSSTLLPSLPPGTNDYLVSQGKDAAERHDATVAAASESPMRINVLDNIINLSKSGVATGPGQDWQNSLLGYAANAPILAPLMKGQQNKVAQFQELQKFTYQNAIRSWQAAGGTGTDAQMESMAHANPNDHLFPQALQQIAQWGKAAELAVQGKANAQDAYLASRGQNPKSQIAFENEWRNAFDPKVFQYSLMSPQEKIQFAQTLKTPAAAKAFMTKQQKLQQLGALQ